MSADKTKAELELENAELQRRLSARSGGEGGGWIVTTPNPKYTGVSYGISFVNGRAFIPKARPDGRFKMNRLVKDLKYSAREIDAAEMQGLMSETQEPSTSRGMAEALSTPQVFGS
jgi:hypothetical protein